jgi:hypothetical protein
VTLFLPKGLLGVALVAGARRPRVDTPALAVEEGADP